MVMRCVLKHHVCLCVLSTAVLAGLALITAQTKVYAKSLNCNGFVNDRASGEPDDPRGDSETGKIECDGSGRYEGGYGRGNMRGKRYQRVTGGIGGSNGELSGNRDIDMGKDLKPAVKVYNKADITIVGKLTVKDKNSKSTGPAIQVESGGVLTLAGEVDIQNVNKGIVADGKGSSVTVLKGSIGVRGDYVIGVSNGGTVTLMGTNFTGVRQGIVFKGSTGEANVMGVGAKINLANGGTGVIMQGKGRANATVMNMTIQGRGVRVWGLR
ncbi:hypothetical protein BscR1v2_002090 [Bartonella schoenbuchensis R1]|uniref:Uncharacterized protein n=2 Tax=Bartonella schoenbuchensis TaxID=165694 RepID=A0A1S6XNF5_BARSR|nr:hypothetical protein BscR1v2_002090 [Bartonella schoenbuchensis R1]